MDVVAIAWRVAPREYKAWLAEPLRYTPELVEFVATHGLEPVVRLALHHSRPPDPRLGRPPGYGWQHGLRVARHALRLADSEELAGRAIDRVALFVAALWHDLTHTGADDAHQTSGAELARTHLAGHLPPETLAKVVPWIAHSDRTDGDPELEQRLLWDANALDLHGLMFVVRGFGHGAANGVPPEVMVAVYNAVQESHHAWIERAWFETTRRWMRARARREVAFMRAFAAEIGHPAEAELAALAEGLGDPEDDGS